MHESSLFISKPMVDSCIGPKHLSSGKTTILFSVFYFQMKTRERMVLHGPWVFGLGPWKRKGEVGWWKIGSWELGNFPHPSPFPPGFWLQLKKERKNNTVTKPGDVSSLNSRDIGRSVWSDLFLKRGTTDASSLSLLLLEREKRKPGLMGLKILSS